MKLVFCDDDKAFLSLLQDYAESWAKSTNRTVDCFKYRSSEDFLLSWVTSTMYDVIFLDIKMEPLSGLELARVIRSINADVPIVFITGYSEFALDGYSVDASSYLLKPVTRETFHECMDRLTKRLVTDQQKSFLIQKDGRTIKLLHHELYYFEARSHLVAAHTAKGEIEFRTRMADIEDSLTNDDGFIKIHRSFLVNIKHVRIMNRKTVVMENGDELPISRSYSREAYNEYIRFNNE